jgi:hypothetical protein
MSPWPRREENKLREIWNEEYKSDVDKATELYEHRKLLLNHHPSHEPLSEIVLES